MEDIRSKSHSSKFSAVSLAGSVLCAAIWGLVLFANSFYGEIGFNIPVVFSAILLLLTVAAILTGIAAFFQKETARLFAGLGIAVGVLTAGGIVYDIYIFLRAVGAL
ncbi:MAG TPA: hypothetical protein VF599_20755 [Pyrinomonadaceae bacterium]|jgi:hypothetical protein